jgi:hypothetical protein
MKPTDQPPEPNEPKPGLPELITKKQFAERIQVCARSVDQLLADRKIPYLRITGRLIRIPWPEALTHLNRNYRITPRGQEGGQ